MKGKKKRMQYLGPNKDIQENPWIRLVHGKHYEVEKNVLPGGKVRARVHDGIDVCRMTYLDNKSFEREWYR